MKTIDLSNERARYLVAMLAADWASLSVRIVAASTDVNVPFQYFGETWKGPQFKKRLKKAERELSIIAGILRDLGATLPKVDRDAFVVPWIHPVRPSRKKQVQVSTPKARAWREEATKAIIASVE